MRRLALLAPLLALSLAPPAAPADPGRSPGAALLRLATVDRGPRPSEQLENAEAPVALMATPGADVEGARFDPLLVYYPAGACEAGVLEVQRWDRTHQRWQPHPDHARIRGDGCRVEDAGGLLNEVRVRCVDPAGQRWSSNWRVGARLWEPPDESPCPIGGARPDEPDPLSISIAEPARGAVLRRGEPRAIVSGDARLGAFGRHEILLALDTSRPPEPGARAVLAAQVRSALRLVEGLRESLGRNRVGVLSYAGAGPRGGAAARVELPLSSDPERLAAALAALEPRGSWGDESFPAALELALRELGAAPGAQSAPRLDARKLLLVFSDGRPALPFGEGDRNREAFERSIRAARRAHREGVELHLFALGGEATPFSALAYRMLHRTPGSFQRVGDLDGGDWLARFSVARIARVRIENLTTQEMSEDVELRPDGHFQGQLPLADGPNRVRVTALASDGRERSVEFELRFERERSSAERALDAERERMRRVRARQEKQLELELERRPPSGG